MTTKKKSVKLIDMWRMRQILRYFYEYPFRKGAEQMEHHQNPPQPTFKDWILYQKGFLEAWQSTLKRIPRYFGLLRGTSDIESKREYRRDCKANLLIEECRQKWYFDQEMTHNLKLTSRGLRFSRSWVGFFNECFKEYPVLAIFIGSISILSLGKFVFNWLKPFFVTWLEV